MGAAELQTQDQIAGALEAARQLARNGIPVFIAPPSDDPKDTSGFRLPGRWQQTRPDPAVLDGWQPGWAVCAVMGCGLDLVDFDLYNGADQGWLDQAGLMPAVYGYAATASGGVHAFVASMNVKSKNGLYKGIDIKAGTADGKSRGFAFIAPTVKPSKVTGQLTAYYWLTVPDAAAAQAAGTDASGQQLAALIRSGITEPPASPNGQAPAQNGQAPSAAGFMAQRGSPWGSYDPETRKGADGISAMLADEGRNNGVMRLAASLRGQGGWALENAIAYMREHIWPLIDPVQGGHEFSEDEFEAIIHAAWRQWPDGILASVEGAERNAPPPGQEEQPQYGAMGGPARVTCGYCGGVVHAPWPHGKDLHGLDLTDVYLSLQVVHCCLAGAFLWARGMGWLRWTGMTWKLVDAGVVHDAVASGFRDWYAHAAKSEGDNQILGKMATLLSRARITAVTDLSHGNPLITRDAADFDAYPDMINTPGAVVSLRTGEVFPNDPRWLFTKVTSGMYRPGFTHDDWEQALEALDPPERKWFQRRIGQGITGHPPADGIMPVLQGSGENGKTCLTTDGPVRALGDFAQAASHKLITSQAPGRSEHSTEMADLRGQRLLIGEELAEGRSIDVTALKRIQDVGTIRARYVHKDNISFTASHSLMVTTNYVPVINETDHGTWRRLALVRFPYSFRASAELCVRDTDKLGDPGLKQRIRLNQSGQHDAIVTWAVEGARQWYDEGYRDAPLTGQITTDTLDWRKSADRILGFALEMLQPDPEACILAGDMLDQFNAWIARNGHTAWAKETFTPRFADHEWATRHGIENRRTAALRGLVPWPVPGLFRASNAMPKQATVWMGVRPRTSDDLGESGGVAAVAEPLANLSSGSRIESFTSTSATPATPHPDSAQVAEVAEVLAPSRDNSHDTQPVTTRPEPAEPAEPPAEQSQPVAEKRERKTPAERKPRQPKSAPPRPDPAAEGPVHQLPALVARNPADISAPPLVFSCTLDEAVAAVTPYLGNLSVDVEHSGYPVSHADYALRLVQLGGEGISAVFDPADAAQAEVIRDLVARAVLLHAHSACANLVPLAWAGLGDRDSMWARMEDSVLIAKLGDPGLAGSDESELKKLSAALLGGYSASKPADEARSALFKSGRWLTNLTAVTPRDKSGWAMVRKDCEVFERYAGSDVLDLAAVLRVLPRPDEAVLARERAFQAICSRVAHDGFALDHPHIRLKIGEYEQARDAAQRRVAELTGGAIDNPSSSKQVPAALAAMGVPLGRSKKTGNPSAAADVLEPLAKAPGYEHAELCKAILEYRHDVTTLGLLLEPLNTLCTRGDGRMRPVVYTINADTGRTSCVRPNGQQFSRQGGIRACVVADEGMAGIAADFSGVEIRVGAALSGDRALLDAELSTRCQACGYDPCHPACGKDQKGLHWMAARLAFGENAVKEDRYNSKRIIFSKMFGGGPDTGAKQVGVPVSAGRAVHRAFEQIAPRFASWDKEMRAYLEAGNRGWQAYSGRTIWLPRGRSHAATNYMIQGTARELLVDGVLRWGQTRWGRYPLLPIHDEVLTWVPAAEAEEALDTLMACMRNQRFYEIYGVPIEAAGEGPFHAWPDSS